MSTMNEEQAEALRIMDAAIQEWASARQAYDIAEQAETQAREVLRDAGTQMDAASARKREAIAAYTAALCGERLPKEGLKG